MVSSSSNESAKADSSRPRPWLAVAVVVLCFLLNAALFFFDFEYIEALFYDARTRLRIQPDPSGFIATVAIDQTTVQKLGRVPNASDLRILVEKIKQAEPRMIVLAMPLEDFEGSDAEKAGLAEALVHPRVVVAVDDVALKGEKNPFKLKAPFDQVATGGAPITADKNIFARDEVTRRALISYQGQPLLHAQLGGLLNPEVLSESKVRGRFEFLGSQQVYVDFRQTGTYPLIPAYDVARLNLASSLKDKIVFVGRDIQSTSKDYVRTPYSRDIVAMTSLEAHANVLDTLILNSAPVRTPRWVGMILTGIISLAAVFTVLTLKPTIGLAVMAGIVLVFGFVSWCLFAFFGIWIEMAHSLLAVFVGYYFFVPYRLIVENRRSWEYYQRNQLLTQVEELKTNFLRMMSHDLKTPIARIQGMAEVVLNDPRNLTRLQLEAMTTLRKSTDELLDFVTGILNLTRIESKEVKLHLHSRDINALIAEVMEKYIEQARLRNIQIDLDLEPMFSLKMDPDLMRQVVCNLLENAIKYSPDSSVITIRSFEKDGTVFVQVKDQGPGIPEEEQEKVFTKFYRSTMAHQSNVKGSGLGLYLSQYFAQLHRGKIALQSSVGAGSTFTIEIPNDLGVHTKTDPVRNTVSQLGNEAHL